MYYNTNTNKRVSELPKSTENISNFHLLSNDELTEHGYYPIIRPDIADWQEYTADYIIDGENAVQGIQSIDIEKYRERKISEVNQATHETIISRFTMEDQQNQSDKAIEILGKIIMGSATQEDQLRLMEINSNKQWRDGVIAEGREKKQAIGEERTHEEIYNVTIG